MKWHITMGMTQSLCNLFVEKGSTSSSGKFSHHAPQETNHWHHFSVFQNRKGSTQPYAHCSRLFRHSASTWWRPGKSWSIRHLFKNEIVLVLRERKVIWLPSKSEFADHIKCQQNFYSALLNCEENVELTRALSVFTCTGGKEEEQEELCLLLLTHVTKLEWVYRI